MRSKDKMLIVLVAVVSLGLTACAGSPPGPTPVPPTPTDVITVEDLVGVWYMASLETFLQFSEDGTFSFANAQRELEEAPFDAGQYRLEGTSLTFITNKESKLCAGQTGSYEIELTEEGQVQFVPKKISARCGSLVFDQGFGPGLNLKVKGEMRSFSRPSNAARTLVNASRLMARPTMPPLRWGCSVSRARGAAGAGRPLE